VDYHNEGIVKNLTRNDILPKRLAGLTDWKPLPRYRFVLNFFKGFTASYCSDMSRFTGHGLTVPET
jgi:hypothetical protein